MAAPGPVPSAHHSADAGQFWLVKSLEGEPAWPVMICPEEIVVEFFKKATKRPASARRADGTFSKAYAKSQQLLPVLYLGNLRMRWAKRIQLEPLDHQAATATLNTHLDTSLANAYTEYLEQYGRNDIHYWSSRLLAKRLAEVGSGDEEENEAVEAQVQTQTQPYEISEPANPNQLSRVHRDDESDEENLRSLLPKSKRVKLESGSTASLSSIPSHASCHASLETGQSSHRMPLKMTAVVGNIKVKAEQADLSKVKIYVDNPIVIYSVKTSNLKEASPVLASYYRGGKDGSYIMAPWLLAISAKDFRPVAEFVESGGYHPYTIDAGTDRAHLAGVSEMEGKKMEVLKCGVIYTLARQCEMPKLQALVISKLKLLQPFPAEELIAMSELAFGSDLDEEDGLDRLVVNYIVDHYFVLPDAATSRLNQLLAVKVELRRQVFATMAGTYGRDGSRPIVKEEAKVDALTPDGGRIKIFENKMDDENTAPSSLARLPDSPANAAAER
ncbi:MAG: hypothetical protein Q9178_007641 [Gyalolechia marmorata]